MAAASGSLGYKALSRAPRGFPGTSRFRGIYLSDADIARTRVSLRAKDRSFDVGLVESGVIDVFDRHSVDHTWRWASQIEGQRSTEELETVRSKAPKAIKAMAQVRCKVSLRASRS